MQGYRIHMEDSHTHILSLPDDPGTSFFAVYDGHGGANIGKYASKHLHKFVVRRSEYQTDVSEAMKKVWICRKSRKSLNVVLDGCFRRFWTLMRPCSTRKN